MARKMNKVEQFFVANNPQLSADELRKEFKNEVSAGEIRKFKEALNLQKENEPESPLKNKTQEEVTEVASNNDHTPGKLMGRREGIVVMTEAASELSDAREVLRPKRLPNYLEKHSDKIHKIRK